MNRQVDEAVSRLEELLIAGKQIVVDIREMREYAPVVHRRQAYARLYWLRRELGRIVATLGVGVPTGIQNVAAHYESLIKNED